MTGFLPDFTISSASLEYVQVPISLSSGGNPTGDSVSMSFPAVGAEPSVFVAGSWTTLSGLYYANCLVGPGGAITLPVGYYYVYVKIIAVPEAPVIFSGLLEVT